MIRRPWQCDDYDGDRAAWEADLADRGEEPCPRCTSSGRHTDPRCPVCLGTGAVLQGDPYAWTETPESQAVHDMARSFRRRDAAGLGTSSRAPMWRDAFDPDDTATPLELDDAGIPLPNEPRAGWNDRPEVPPVPEYDDAYLDALAADLPPEPTTDTHDEE